MKNGLQNQLKRCMVFAALLGCTYVPLAAVAASAEPLSSASEFQTKTLTGKVVDEKGQPVIGATVIVQGTTHGAISMDGGAFVIEGVKVGSILETSYFGYVTNTVQVGSADNLVITLKEDALKVEDVVVVGYGTQKKVNLTGAVSSVSAEEMLKRPVSNTTQMLQGQVAGLSIVSAYGQPGGETLNVRVRGAGTFSDAGSSPLVLINGVEGDLTVLDPASVESVSVLKDAASASIYGSRAANGVILVTTKSGSGRNDKFTVSLNANWAVHNPTRMYDQVTNPVDFMNIKNQALINSGYGEEVYTPEQIDLYRNPTDPKYAGFDWLGYMFNPAFAQNYNISLAGQTQSTSYNINMSYLDQEGTMRGFNYERYNVTMDLKSQIKPWLKVGTYVGLVHDITTQPRQGQNDAFLSTVAQAPTYAASLPDDGTGVTKWTGWAFDNESEFFGSNKNYGAITGEGVNRRTKQFDINAQAFFEAQIVKGLTWNTKAAARYKTANIKSNGPVIPIYNYITGEKQKNLDVGAAGLQVTATNTLYTNLYTFLKYDYTSKNQDHNFSVMAGYNQENNSYEYLYGTRKTFMFDLPDLNAGGTDVQTSAGYNQQWALMSLFGRINYNYKERYLVEANIRYDGTSRISSENRWGIFPSFSLGWRLTEEQFMKDLSLTWLNNFKVRGSWGQLGNQNVGLYPYQAMISGTQSYPFDNKNTTLGGGQTAYANRNIKWETTTVTDIGFDMQVFRGLNVTFDWYNKRTTDILRDSQVSYLLGLDSPTINNGEMLNKGVEFSIGYNNRVKNGVFEGLGYNASFFIAHNKNELVSYGALEYGSTNGQKYQVFEEGRPYGQFYMLEALGIYESKEHVQQLLDQKIAAPYSNSVTGGDIIYKDQNGDGKINDEDYVYQDGRFPKFEYSINIGADWKGFDISMLLSGVAGQKFYDNGFMGFGVYPFVQGSSPNKYYVNEMWTPENPVGAKQPRIYYGDMGGEKNTVASTHYLQNSSFLRLKNLTVGYTIPDRFTSKIGISKVRVYFSGDNLATATQFRGLDPERVDDGASVAYPQNRVCAFGINLQF